MSDGAGPAGRTRVGTVVVGIDGSSESCGALRLALEEAARRGARLRVVTAVRLPEYWATAYGMPVPAPPQEMLESARVDAQRVVGGVASGAGEAVERVPVEVQAVAGAPAAVLLDAAWDADLLVVGHRGRGGIAGALLGSVAMQCVLHAPCPVTVVRRAVAAA
ncbi:MAG TPA: universal stress protein [Pseudonocardia sp.]|nr:universal stress protein [Pseudonocardia sp.]